MRHGQRCDGALQMLLVVPTVPAVPPAVVAKVVATSVVAHRLILIQWLDPLVSNVASQ